MWIRSYIHMKLNDVITRPHDDVIKWKHFPRYWPFVREIHRSPVNFPHKGQWRGALMFTLICARINSWVNNGEAGDLRRYPGHYDVIVMHALPSASLLLNCRSWWRHQMETFPRYWPFVRGIHRPPVNKVQWRRALMFSLICAWMSGWVNTRDADD